MKKYLPSVDEIVPGVIIIILGFVAWQIVGPALTSLTSKLPKLPSPAA